MNEARLHGAGRVSMIHLAGVQGVRFKRCSTAGPVAIEGAQQRASNAQCSACMPPPLKQSRHAMHHSLRTLVRVNLSHNVPVSLGASSTLLPTRTLAKLTERIAYKSGLVCSPVYGRRDARPRAPNCAVIADMCGASASDKRRWRWRGCRRVCHDRHHS